MKKVLLIITIIAGVGFAAWLLIPDNSSANGSQPGANSSNQQQLNPAQNAVIAMKNGSAYIYDVRTPAEFNQQHVDGAINFNVEDMQSGSLPNVSKDSQIYVYCRSGNRSNQAKEILKANGFSNVTDLGGLSDLQSAGVL